MADSTILNLNLQTTGSNSGTWGNVTNENLQKLESAIKGYVSIAITGTTQSLSVSSGGTTDEQSNVAIKLTGTLAGNTVLSCEAVETWYIIDNATTMSTHSLTFKPSGGTGVDLVAGSKHIIYTDGTTAFDVSADFGNVKANGTLEATCNVSFDGGTFTFNESSADVDARFEGNGDINLLFTDAGNDRVGIGTNTPAAKLEVDQNASAGAIPVIDLDQGDDDQPFINFAGTSAADSSKSLSSATATAGNKVGAIQVKINGTVRWIRFYDSAV